MANRTLTNLSDLKEVLDEPSENNGNGGNDDSRTFTDEAYDAILRDRLTSPREVSDYHNDPHTQITEERYLELRALILANRHCELDGKTETCVGCEREFQPVKSEQNGKRFGNFILVEGGVSGCRVDLEPVCYFCKTSKSVNRLSVEEKRTLRFLPSYTREDAEAIVTNEIREVEKNTRNLSGLLGRARKWQS